MEIPELPPWDPREEFINDIKRTVPRVVVAFIVGNVAAWIYWPCYVLLCKFISRFRRQETEGSSQPSNGPIELDSFDQNQEEAVSGSENNINFIQSNAEVEEDRQDTTSMRTAISDSVASLRTAVGLGASPESAHSRNRSASNTSHYI